MSDDSDSSGEDKCIFQPLTRVSLANKDLAIAEASAKRKELKKKCTEEKIRFEDEDEGQSDPNLEQEERLPVEFKNDFKSELVCKAIHDIDPFYNNKRTFIVINKRNEIHRFSTTNSLWILDPFNLIRRIAIYISIHRFFSLFINLTILINCIMMMVPITPTIEYIQAVCTWIYTFEFVVKVLARGFMLQPFTYLRDPWNWLDSMVLLFAYVTMGVSFGGMASLRGFRFLRILKSANKFPGLKIISSAIIDSMHNLKNVMILTIFSLGVFAVFGLQIYMGVLTQKCIKEFPSDGSWGNMSNANWYRFNTNKYNWHYPEYYIDATVCGNSSGAGQCPPGYTCLQGYGNNPNYGYTSFDTFGWAFLSTFRLMTQDYWENLYQLVLRSAGPWHMLFFMTVIFMGSFYLLNLILTIVVMSYDKLIKKAEKDDMKNVIKHDDPKIEPVQGIVVDMDDAMAMKDVSEQAAVDNSKASDHKSVSPFMKCIDFCCIWDSKFQKILGLFVLDPFFELFIVICIIINTLFMALDHHDMNRDMEKALRTGNYFFTATYILEAILKIITMSPKIYFKNKWNVFDFVIVVLCILELGLEGVQGLSVLRSVRLLRVLRLAKWWPSSNRLMSIIGKTMGIFGKLTFVMLIIISIFAITGMNLFGKYYIDNINHFPDGDLPRWNFTDFMHSFMTVFRALCGEWIESMWDCMLVGDVSCVPFFLSIVVLGNFVVFNLFLAILLTNFMSSRLSTPIPDNKPNQMTEAFNRISRFNAWIKRSLKLSDKKLSSQIDNAPIASDEDLIENAPKNCCPDKCYVLCSCLNGDTSFWKGWTNLRLKTFQLVQNKYFDTFITIVIVLSSLSLALEDIYLTERPTLQDILCYMDLIIIIIFVLEMLLKWLGLGFKAYFKDSWCLLDFIIVMVLVINLVATCLGAGTIAVFHSMRSLRALRPLRAISRWQSTRVVMNTLCKMMPSIFNVLLLCLMFWLMFAIMGVQLFAGKYFKCIDDNGTTLSYEIVNDREACILNNYTWENSQMNFDHIGNAYLSLLQVATFKGWIQIMNDAIDSRDINKQPIREVNIYMYIYFVIFIIFGSFLTLNLFTGVVVDNFNEQKKKAGGSLGIFMTEDQKKYYNAMKKMGSKKPEKAIPKPQWRPQAIIFEIVTNKKFDIFIMLCIGLNTLVMAFDHYHESEIYSLVLDYLNLIFILIFTIECLLKLFALRHHYFKEPWNRFDFFVVVLSILGLVLTDIIEKYFVSPTLLRTLRIAKIGLILRYFKSTKKIRTLLFTQAIAMPALFNIFMVLFVVMYIYAIFGMSFFMHVKDNAGLDDLYNFKTFGQSMILLFQLSTTAGWDGVLSAVINEENCSPGDVEQNIIGNCGSFTIGTIYILSYIFISFFIVINMYVAVILENYSQATDDVENGLTEDDRDMYYETWQQFDPDATQYIRHDQLSDFLDVLERPLRIHKPNEHKIVAMSIPINKDDQMFCVDVLDALVKNRLIRKSDPIEESSDTAEVNARSNEVEDEPVSSTLKQQREEYCANLIKHACRRHKRREEDEEDK